MNQLKFEREQENSFYRVTRHRVDDYFRVNGLSKNAGLLFAGKALLLGALLIGLYALILLQIGPAWLLILLGIGFGICSLLLAINVGHDASHHVVFTNPILNNGLQRICFILVGVDGYLWRLRHIKSHHLFPNVNGSDTDIDENPFVRLSPNQPWRWHYQMQFLYAPVLYLFAALQTTLWGDFVYLFNKQLPNMEGYRHPKYEYLLFALCKIVYFMVMLVIPLMVLDLPWWQIVIGFLIVNACSSLLFVLLLIGTHFADLADFPVPAADGSVGRTWAEHNMVTACDWSPNNWMAHFISGGSNAHASHHLFPRICHTHYPAVTTIIETTAAEFKVRYNAVTLWGMVCSHFRLLYKLGRRPSLPVQVYQPIEV